MEEKTNEGMERRKFLQRATVVAGATVWATPTVQSLMSPAFATGTGACPPGHLVRFKYDVNENGTGQFDSGDPNGRGADWCLPGAYANADITVDSGGCFVHDDGTTRCIKVVISADGKTATVTVPQGCRIEDLQAKAGSFRNGECDDVEANNGLEASVTLEEKEISFVAGVVCC